MAGRSIKVVGSLVLGLFLLAGCQPKIPPDALKLSPESLELRQRQTRYYDTTDEAKVLSACMAVLQDLGFNLDESETELGMMVGSKNRSAVNPGAVAGAIIVAALTGAYIPTNKDQKMRACLVTCPIGEQRCRIAVRVTFQRIVRNTQGEETIREGLTEPAIYQEFFDRLSKSLFLEAHEI